MQKHLEVNCQTTLSCKITIWNDITTYTSDLKTKEISNLFADVRVGHRKSEVLIET